VLLILLRSFLRYKRPNFRQQAKGKKRQHCSLRERERGERICMRASYLFHKKLLTTKLQNGAARQAKDN